MNSTVENVCACGGKVKATLCVLILAFLVMFSAVNLRYGEAAIVVDLRVHNIDTGLD